MISTSNVVDLALSHLVQVTLLVVLVGLINQLIGRRMPRLASLLWCVVAIKAITPPLVSSWLGVFSWAQAAAASSVAPGSSLMVVDLTPSSGVGRNLMAATLLVWAVGALAFAAWFVMKLVVLEQLLRRDTVPIDDPLHGLNKRLADKHGLRPAARIVVSADDIGPAVAGIWRSTLILPKSLVDSVGEETLAPVMLHELVHTTRHDTGHAMLMSVVRVLWWFHPGIWWATNQAEALVERCVDLTVTRDLKTGLGEYARGLFRVLELRAELKPAPALSGLRPCQITADRLNYLREASCAARPRRASLARWCRTAIACGFAFVVLPGLPLGVLAATCDAGVECVETQPAAATAAVAVK